MRRITHVLSALLLIVSALTLDRLSAQDAPASIPEPAPKPSPAAPTVTVQLKTTMSAATIPVKIKHDGVGADVSVTSTHQEWPGEDGPEALVDGDTTTRWSSDYAEPQCVTVDLGKAFRVKTIRLHWEYALATRYTVSTSVDSKTWAVLHTVAKPTSDTPMPELDTFDISGLTTRYIRIDLAKRINPEWGFSLYEIEVGSKK